MKILVTGIKGQLGQCIKTISKETKGIEFYFTDSNDLDITNKKQTIAFFESKEIDYCVNCAAYTAVDNAEKEEEKAQTVNRLGVKHLAEACKLFNVTLIHVSTDFVFDGEKFKPYNEEDATNPVSIYGKTKLEGEKEVELLLKKYFIIRTSWLYSEYGSNFVKTMLKLSESRSKLSIISDQIGSPTYAIDLTKAILKIITSKNEDYGIYNYSNEGVASWYDFAKAIFEFKNKNIKIEAIHTESYPTPAKRPHFSVLNKKKIKQTLELEIPYWRDSLRICLDKI